MSLNPPYNVKLSFDQIVELVKHLPPKDQVRLSRQLERGVLTARLSELDAFRPKKPVDEATILRVTDEVRASIHARKKGR